MAKPTFEKALTQLEQIVQELEGGELSLEKALARFEEGMTLSRFCSDKLAELERRITVLVQTPEGALVEQPMAPVPRDDIA